VACSFLDIGRDFVIFVKYISHFHTLFYASPKEDN